MNALCLAFVLTAHPNHHNLFQRTSVHSTYDLSSLVSRHSAFDLDAFALCHFGRELFYEAHSALACSYIVLVMCIDFLKPSSLTRIFTKSGFTIRFARATVGCVYPKVHQSTSEVIDYCF